MDRYNYAIQNENTNYLNYIYYQNKLNVKFHSSNKCFFHSILLNVLFIYFYLVLVLRV
jgi:hypothetical protein